MSAQTLSIEPDTALSCSSGLDITMALGSSISHSDVNASWPSDANLDYSGG